MWILLAFGSALFSGLTSITAKCGIKKTDSTVATAIRTAVVLVMAWLTVFATGKTGKIKETPKNELIFIVISGILTGASWICYYKALQLGEVSIVAPIDKLSIVVTVVVYRVQRKTHAQIVHGLSDDDCRNALSAHMSV